MCLRERPDDPVDVLLRAHPDLELRIVGQAEEHLHGQGQVFGKVRRRRGLGGGEGAAPAQAVRDGAAVDQLLSDAENGYT